LDCKAVVDVQKDQTTVAEHAFDVNGRGYVIKGPTFSTSYKCEKTRDAPGIAR
jgi:hypothetical protein